MKLSVRKDLPYVDPPCSDTSSSDDDVESQKAILVDSKGQCHFADFHCLKINVTKSKKSGLVLVIVEKFQKKKLVSFCKFVMHFINLLIV